MPPLSFENGSLVFSGVQLVEIAAKPCQQTPVYIYNLDGIDLEIKELKSAFAEQPFLIAYALKANSAGAIVRSLAEQGVGADVVSGGELRLALRCGISPERVVFSGVAKSNEELDQAIACRIGALQMESLEEIERVEARAQAAGLCVSVSLRINPELDIDAIATHRHIATGHDEAKFGIAPGELSETLNRIDRSRWLDCVGLASHIGSQLTSIDPYLASARALFSMAVDAADRLPLLRFLDTGGGFGIDYGEGCSVRPADFVRAVRSEQKARGLEGKELRIEPGRSIVGAHGLLLARVIQTKVRSRAGGKMRWLFIDAGMNDLIRPALYHARHRILPVDQTIGTDAVMWHVAGPVCESSDDFGEHPFSAIPKSVALLDVGAYGYTMASHYNGRPLPGEIFLRNGEIAEQVESESIDVWVQGRMGRNS